MFTTQDTNIFKLWIPLKNGLSQDESVKSVTIESGTVLQSKEGEEGMMMTALTMNRRATSAGKRAVQGWRRGVSLRLTEKKDEWCTECWLNIMVDVQHAGLYRI